MASAKEIQDRIRGIKDTRKITRAMYMISSIKMQKARQKLADTEPYFFALQDQISSILYHFPEIDSRYFENGTNRNPNGKKAIVVMSSDKGMAGAYNHNIMKAAEDYVKDFEPGSYEFYCIGELGRQYLKFRGFPIADFEFTATNPSVHRARVIMEILVNKYHEGELSEIDVIYTRSVNSMKSVIEYHPLLPLRPHEFIKNDASEDAQYKSLTRDMNYSVEGDQDAVSNLYSGDFFIWPNPHHVLHQLVYNYVAGYIYGTLVEATASEENARMSAMKSATDNAEKMLAELSTQYNRVRQAAITQEITEIAAGAQALKRAKKKAVR